MSQGFGAYKPGSGAVVQKSARVSFSNWVGMQRNFCWHCKKDKTVKGGKLTFFGGLQQGAIRKFICADCFIEKQVKERDAA